MKPWQDSRAVKILVGATAILVVLWWFITGDLPFLTRVAFSEADESKPKAVEIWGIVGPMLVQACFIVGSAVVALLTGAWQLVLGAFSKGSAETVQAASATPTGSVASTDLRDAAFGLCKAAEENDLEAMEVHRTAIRLPRAIKLHSEAILRGDLDTADKLMAELRTLIHPAGGTEAAAEVKAPQARKARS